MVTVSVKVNNADRKVGAMAKALAVEVSGFAAVAGTTKEFLAANSRYDFNFDTDAKADEFRQAILEYLQGKASIVS